MIDKEETNDLENDLKRLLSTRIVKQVKSTRIFIELNSEERLRSHFKLPLYGDDETLDKNLSKALNTFFHPSKTENKLEGESDEYLTWLSNDDDSVSNREIYLRLHYWLIPDSDTASIYERIYGRKIEPIDKHSIPRLHKTFRRKFRSETRALRRSKAVLLDFSLKDLVGFFPLFSAMLVVGGYFHTYLLYGNFNVSYGRFFAISDYLASSIEQIQHALFGLVSYVIGVFHGSYRRTTISRLELQRKIGFDSIVMKIGLSCSLIYLAIWLFSESLIVWWFPESALLSVYDKVRYDPYPTLFAISFVAYALISFVSSRYFRNPTSFYRPLMAAALFLASLYVFTHEEIIEIRKGRPGTIFEMQTDNKAYTEKETTFIGSNSRYIFLFSSHESKVEIIPVNKVKRISFTVQ